MFICPHVKYPIFLSDINQTWNFRTIFKKSSSIKFHENPSSVCPVVLCGRTIRRTNRHDEANSRYAIFWRCLRISNRLENILRNGEFHSMRFSTNIIRKLKSRTIAWTRHVTCIGDKRKRTQNVYNHPHTHVWSEKLVGHRCILEDNIKMVLRQIGCEMVNYIQLALNSNI